jgi:hypothetical protein
MFTFRAYDWVLDKYIQGYIIQTRALVNSAQANFKGQNISGGRMLSQVLPGGVLRHWPDVIAVMVRHNLRQTN